MTGPGAGLLPAAQRPLFVLSATLTIVSVLALTIVGTLSVVGAVQHARSQQTAFAQLRAELATATAPVTQTDGAGRLYPLGTPIAVVDIPQINVREVVFEGTTSGVMMAGPGHRRDTPLPGQAGVSVIMGRQSAYGAPFRAIGDLVPGNVFRVTTGQGEHAFRVVAVRRAGDPQSAGVEAGKGRVTLMTAAGTPWVPEGVIRVDADLLTPTQPAGPRPLTLAALPVPEKALQGDPTAWIWIMLLAQALLLGSIAATWARYRWGAWQTWLSGGPALLALGIALTDQAARLLPNLL